MSNEIIICENITKSFGGVLALKNVNISFEKNKITGIIGGNGAGKTTLFNIITGFCKCDDGKIILDFEEKKHNITNKNCESLAKYHIVRTFQHIRLFNEFNVFENILAGAYALNKPKKSIEKWIKTFDLLKIKDKMVKDLPYGTRRLIEMARCLATGAKIIFLDEIGAGMTKEELKNIADIILKLNKEYKITFIVIEHNMNFIKSICDKVYAMDNGEIIKYGSADVVLSDKNVINSIIGG